MSPRKPPVKMPLPDTQRCEMMDTHGKRCVRRAEYIMRRPYEGETRLCRTCAYKERDQRQRHPEYFGKVRFIQINRYAPVE